MSLVTFAKTELDLCRASGAQEYKFVTQAVIDDILTLIEQFSNQGHSGTSAPRVAAWFSRLAKAKIEHEDSAALLKHATTELSLCGIDPTNTADKASAWIALDIIELIETFATQPYNDAAVEPYVDLVTRLMNYEICSPLTGNDDEWVLISDATSSKDGCALYQNRRASSVFKSIRREDGAVLCYQYDRYIFVEPGGAAFTTSMPYTSLSGQPFLQGSRHTILEWPYTPTHERIKVAANTENVKREA